MSKEPFTTWYQISMRPAGITEVQARPIATKPGYLRLENGSTVRTSSYFGAVTYCATRQVAVMLLLEQLRSVVKDRQRSLSLAKKNLALGKKVAKRYKKGKAK